MESIYNFFLHIVNTLPPWAAWGIVGFLLSVTFTQMAKFALPLVWPPKTRHRMTQGIAFTVAFATIAIMVKPPVGLVVALLVGFWSPMAYWLLRVVVLHHFPWLKDAFSGDVRGTIFGERREHK